MNPLSNTQEADPVTRSLYALEDARIAARTIDAAVTNRVYDGAKVVMTSMGDQKKATITPYYPAFTFEHAIHDRIRAAAEYERPFVEAAVSVNGPDVRNGMIGSTHVIVRSCLNVSLEETNTVMQAAAYYDMDPGKNYGGTMEGVIMGIFLSGDSRLDPSATGFVYHNIPSNPSDFTGKWSVRRSTIDNYRDHAITVAREIRSVEFTRTFV